MTKRTVQQIQTEHSAKAGKIMTRYQDEIQEIRNTRTLPDGAYLDRLTEEQRFQFLREQKEQKAAEAHERTVREYTREVDRYHAETLPKDQHPKVSSLRRSGCWSTCKGRFSRRGRTRNASRRGEPGRE